MAKEPILFIITNGIYNTIVDILRNEKPVLFFFYEATKYSGITTNEAAVVEGE